MKTRFGFFLVVMLAFALAFAGGCYTKNSNTNILDVIQNPTGPSGTPSASPAPGASAIAKVSVGPFAWDCTKPSDLHVPVGCVVTLTATPKYANGDDVPLEVSGPDVEWAVLSGGTSVTLSSWPGNEYNRYLRGVAAGPFRVQARIKGVAGVYEGEVR